MLSNKCYRLFSLKLLDDRIEIRVFISSFTLSEYISALVCYSSPPPNAPIR